MELPINAALQSKACLSANSSFIPKTGKILVAFNY
jgi:hypothetical protein